MNTEPPKPTHDLQILVRSVHGLNDIELWRIQGIEKAIDAAVGPMGFGRVSTTKAGEYFSLDYYQFVEPSPSNPPSQA